MAALPLRRTAGANGPLCRAGPGLVGAASAGAPSCHRLVLAAPLVPARSCARPAGPAWRLAAVTKPLQAAAVPPLSPAAAAAATTATSLLLSIM